MKQVARFVCRPTNEGKADVGIFLCFKQNEELQPNRVYEIQEILGELVIKDIGPSILTDPCANGPNGAGWARAYGEQLSVFGATSLLTQEEWKEACTKQK